VDKKLFVPILLKVCYIITHIVMIIIIINNNTNNNYVCNFCLTHTYIHILTHTHN